MATGTEYYYIKSENGDTSESQRYTVARLKITEDWNDETNTSDFLVEYQASFSASGHGLTQTWRSRGTVTFNGIVVATDGQSAGSKHVIYPTWLTLFSLTVNDVPHNADGSLSITIEREPGSYYSTLCCLHATLSGNNYYGGIGSGDYILICHKNDVGAVVRIDNGISFDQYMVYIDNGTNFDLYAPYIDNGESWELYNG